MTNFSDNGTEALFPRQHLGVYQLLGLIFLTLVVVVGVLGNTTLIISVLRKTELRTSPTFVILTSLAMDDLLLLLSCPTGITYIMYNEKAGEFVCKAYYYIVFCTTAISIDHLLLFSVVRYLILTRPFFAHRYITAKNILWTCIVIWVIIWATGSFTFETVGLVRLNTTDKVTYTACLPKTNEEINLGLSALFGCYLPLILIVAFHIAKVTTLRQTEMQSANNIARRQVSSRIVLAILASLLVTWLPFNIYFTLLYVFNVAIPSKVRLLEMFFVALIFTNSALNPILYFFMSRQRRVGICPCLRFSREKH